MFPEYLSTRPVAWSLKEAEVLFQNDLVKRIWVCSDVSFTLTAAQSIEEARIFYSGR